MCICFNKFSNNWKQNCYVSIDYALLKSLRDLIEFDTKQTKQRQKPSFLNKSVKNADFYKYILKKIMTTHE